MNTTPTPPPTAAPLVVLQQVRKHYREGERQHTVLHEMSTSFAEGQTTALMGKSGSGKTTLLNLISGIDTPSSGDIRIADQSLVQMSEHARTLFRRQHIGFVFQFFNLIATLTVLENVLLPLELNGQRDQAARQHAHHLLERVGLADRQNAFPDRLSGGEQQRIAIARALVHDPLLVLADEPTGNLDSTTSQQVLTLLDSLTRQAGKTMLLVTHSPEAARIADQVLYLRQGSLHTSVPEVAWFR